ncbi:2-dehydro-3-deoxy-6-phosphogalactonate aldolase [Massilia sp. CCM 8734]|uniref:2-dehydro-3-deoxy-6-phosphogalactonate aldolase n=1 Tax=Massilia sp. CCM 8734 TaxID=2609283 RepID=UPI00142148BC|nr:2-dehydro-3-deoxy-6-phosphogalactonate aldolase [Massilia sp. CCM 8734]NIA00852.1 2-dehydro-3-deoxy-6-phosphogalactonate aldolase [Massilia sp. CCM 8734]
MDTTQFKPSLVAILRGLQENEAEAAGAALFGAGFRLLEVPLNRPGALASIALLARMAPAGAIVGGGTMLSVADVDAVHAAGGRMLLAPNCNAQVIARAAALGMLCAPGVATPSEAFEALAAGAHALKIFPAEVVGYAGLKAFKTVLPAGTPLWPVGGVTPDTMADWVAAGATGFGIGGALYSPGTTPEILSSRAQAFVDAWNTTQKT